MTINTCVVLNIGDVGVKDVGDVRSSTSKAAGGLITPFIVPAIHHWRVFIMIVTLFTISLTIFLPSTISI